MIGPSILSSKPKARPLTAYAYGALSPVLPGCVGDLGDSARVVAIVEFATLSYSEVCGSAFAKMNGSTAVPANKNIAAIRPVTRLTEDLDPMSFDIYNLVLQHEHFGQTSDI